MLPRCKTDPVHDDEAWQDYLDLIRFEGEGGATTSEPPEPASAPRC